MAGRGELAVAAGAMAHVGHGQADVVVTTVCPSKLFVIPPEVWHLRPAAEGILHTVFVAVDDPIEVPVHVVAPQELLGP
jgi:hypothetical protein